MIATPNIAPVQPDEATAEQAQAAIAEEFGYFSDWTERYQYLIDLGRKLPEFPQEWRTDEFKVTGCQSQVWLVPSGDASLVRSTPPCRIPDEGYRVRSRVHHGRENAV